MSIKDNFPSVGPSLSLNFARSKTLDPRITFARPSTSGDATYINENGLIVTAAADEPRFDHKYENGVVKSLGLLVEEQRTNLIIDSEDINQTVGYWSQRNYTDTTYDSSAVLPGISTTGSTTGCYYLGGSSNTATGVGYDFAFRTVNIGIQTNTTYNFTIYAKPRSANASQFLTRILDYTGTTITQTHNLSSGWERYTTEITTSSTAANVICMVGLVTATDEVFLWGAQLEAGAFPTSYIPTSGSTKTRSADIVTMTGTNFSDWYNQNEGSLIFHGNNQADASIAGNVNGFVCINDSTSNTRIDFRQRIVNSILSSNGTSVNWTTVSSPSNITDITDSSFQKAGMAYSSNNHAQAQNGYLTRTSTTLLTPLNATRLVLFMRDSQTFPTNGVGGHIAQLSYYPKRLTNTQLQNLTK